jgi:peptidoglycan LD-endopeptidase LytH
MINSNFVRLLDDHNDYAPVMDQQSLSETFPMDFSSRNQGLSQVNLMDTVEFNHYVFELIKSNKATCGAGGYGEDRVIYKRSLNFEGVEARSIHLGVDIWAPAYFSVYSPLPAIIHSFNNNEGFGNYGPTIILEHHLQDKKFYTLYGHLSKKSLSGLKQGQPIKKGEKFAELGPFPENGDWPPHLHFQVIDDLQGWLGDYPGVSAPSQKLQYLTNCPDPNLILKIPCLNKIIV